MLLLIFFCCFFLSMFWKTSPSATQGIVFILDVGMFTCTENSPGLIFKVVICYICVVNDVRVKAVSPACAPEAN